MAKKTNNKEFKPEVTSRVEWSNDEYITIIGLGNNKHLVEGKEYICTNEIAKILVGKGSAKVK